MNKVIIEYEKLLLIQKLKSTKFPEMFLAAYGCQGIDIKDVIRYIQKPVNMSENEYNNKMLEYIDSIEFNNIFEKYIGNKYE